MLGETGYMNTPTNRRPTRPSAKSLRPPAPILPAIKGTEHAGFIEPATIPRFVIVRSAEGNRLGLLTQPFREQAEVTEGPMLPEGINLKHTITTLNQVLWNGQREDLDTMFNCAEGAWSETAQARTLELLSLSTLPLPTDMEIGGEPLRVIMSYWASLANEGEVTVQDGWFHEFDAAIQLGVQLRVENVSSEDGDVSLHVLLLSGAVEARSVNEIWPVIPGATASERVAVDSSEVGTVFDDPRWVTHRARATWAWIVDEEERGLAFLVADFFNEAIPVETDD